MSKKNKKQKKQMRKTIQQDILTFDGITADGILSGSGIYSKLYALPDGNFAIEPEDKQYDILESYSALVNSFPDNVDVNIVIVNKRNTMTDLAKSYHLADTGAEWSDYIHDYNRIIDAKIKEGDNDIQKDKYILLTVHTRSLSEARSQFNTIDISIQEKAKTINKVGVEPVNAIDRLRIMKQISTGNLLVPFDKEYGKYYDIYVDNEGKTRSTLSDKKLRRAGMSIKDIIAPEQYVKERGHLILGEERICKSFIYSDLPQTLDTKFLTVTTDIPYEMVTVIQLKTVPRKKALRSVKMMNTSIKADVIKASQQAYKNGYDPSLMDEDLQLMQEEAKALRTGIVVNGKKLFYATIVTTLFAKNEAELKEITSLYTSKCQDYSVTPNSLIGQQIRAFRMAMLLGDSDIVIDRMITSDDARALFPFHVQEIMDKRGHFYGINAVSKNMIMYDRKRSKLANGIIVGQSGSGKSFITKGEIIVNLMDSNDDMIILDPENEYREIANKFGGVQIDLETKTDYHINPCDMSMEWDDPKANPLAEKCDYMVSLVEAILGNGRTCNSFEVRAIHSATQTMYASYMQTMKERYDDGDRRNIDTTICPTLVDFYNTLCMDDSIEARKISQAIEPYCIGVYNIFAHHTNVKTDKRLMVFNLFDLPDKMREMAMRVCLSYIWTKVVENRERNKIYGVNKSVWVYLDEFHLFFTTESSANTIKAYYKRVRKYGGIMTGITQDVSDLLRSPQGQSMFDNSGFFIFLQQSPNGRYALQNLYGWSDSQIDYLNEKGSGVGLIYNNSSLIPFNYRLPVDSLTYELLSTNPNDSDRL